jgi:small subunit ribosomal protein S20
MANNKSAQKRIQVTKRNRLQNRFYKSSVQTLVKRFFKNLELYKSLKNSETKKKLKESLNLTYSIIDKALKKKLFHKNTAARKKSKLALYFKTVF